MPAEVRPILKFAYATGWRTPSEVLPLEWRNVDWAGRCVRLAMVVLPSEFLTGALDEMKNDLLATKRSGDALVTFSLEESYLVPPLLQKR